MNTLKISPMAMRDLGEIKKYITNELESPVAAAKTLAQIIKRIRKLEQFPEAGARLSAIVEVATRYRYVISGNYMAFYRYENSTVYVDRVLYAKRDYMAILFGQEPK